MRQIKSEIIEVPEIIFDSNNGTSDALSYAYGNQKAKPWLKEYVEDPFRSGLRELVFQKAEREGGYDEAGNLIEGFSISEILDGKEFVAKAYPTKWHKYGEMLEEVEDYLVETLEGNKNGVIKKGVRRVGDKVYISLSKLLSVLEEFEDETSTQSYRTSLPIKDPETGKSLSLSEDIREMKIELDPSRYSEINERTAQEYFKARSLRLREIKPLLDEYEKMSMDFYGIPEEDLEERKDFVYDSGEYTVRFVFEPSVKTSHKDIFMDVFGPKTTQKVSSSTGDMTILEKKAFTGDYSYPRGNLEVMTELKSEEDSDRKRGEATILRTKHEDARTYPIFSYGDEVYVSIPKVLNQIDDLRAENTSIETDLNIEAIPNI